MIFFLHFLCARVEIERDRYGFALKPGQKVEEKPKKVPKQKTWDSFLKKISNDFSKLENSKPLRDLIRSEGIPTEIRGKVYNIHKFQIIF